MIDYLKYNRIYKRINNERLSLCDYKTYKQIISNDNKTGNDIEDELYSIGIKYFSFAVLNYTKWIIQKAKEDDIDVVCFLSRDGYILKKCYDYYKDIKKEKIPESKYLYSSRSIFYTSAITSDADWVDELMSNIPKGQSIESYLSRWDIPEIEYNDYLAKQGIDKNYLINSDDNKKVIRQLYNHFRKVIEINAVQNRNVLKEYWFSEDLIGKKIAFVDLGWNGSCQACAEKIIREMKIDIKPLFYFFGIIQNDKCKKMNDSIYRGCFFKDNKPNYIFKKVFNGIPIMDSFFSAPHPYILKIEKRNDDFVAVYDNTDALRNSYYMSYMHNGAIDGIKRIMQDEKLISLSDRIGIVPLIKLINYPTKDEAKVISNFKSSVTYGSEKYNTNIIKKIHIKDVISNRKKALRLYENTMWKKGFKKINSWIRLRIRGGRK